MNISNRYCNVEGDSNAKEIMSCANGCCNYYEYYCGIDAMLMLCEVDVMLCYIYFLGYFFGDC